MVYTNFLLFKGFFCVTNYKFAIDVFIIECINDKLPLLFLENQNAKCAVKLITESQEESISKFL